MAATSPPRPAADEHSAYYGRYIALVPDGDLLALLARQGAEAIALLASLSDRRARSRPGLGEWSALEIAGHLADTERVLAYRALRIARQDPAPLEGVTDFAPYVAAAGFGGHAVADVAADLAAVRRASLTLFRALGYLVAGHELHHLPDLRRARGGASI